MPNIAKLKAALKDLHNIDLNIGRNVGNKVNALTDAEIEAAIKARFPGANIASHKVIPAQPESKFGPFEPTSQVSIQSPSVALNEAIGGLSQDLRQQAIPGINKTTQEAVLAGPQAAEWGGQFSKQHFVRPGEETAYGNLQQQFKSQFEPGYYHGSPSNEIKVFDPTKSDKDLLATPQATFLTKQPAFAESFLPESAHEIVENSGRYYPYSMGSTIYPVSVNKGKHFDFDTPEGQAVARAFLKEKLMPEYGREKAARWLYSAQDELNNWKAMEHPDFLKHLQDTGHDTFAVTEGGVKNIGVFKPENIRGKFAEFDPAEATNPDFMKAEGGQVEGYAPGGKVGALSELIQMISNRGGTAAGKRLERAADLVPNLEQKYSPSALREAFTGDNATAAMIMKPSQFDNYANPLTEKYKASPSANYRIGDPAKFESYKDMPEGSYQDYLNYLKQYVEPGGGGFSSVPYLQLGKDYLPTIKGHEGRHRSGVLEMMGDEPSLVIMQPRSELREQFPRRSQQEYLEALKNAEAGPNGLIRVSPQKSEELGNRPMLDLPELFKKGGLV